MPDERDPPKPPPPALRRRPLREVTLGDIFDVAKDWLGAVSRGEDPIAALTGRRQDDGPDGQLAECKHRIVGRGVPEDAAAEKCGSCGKDARTGWTCLWCKRWWCGACPPPPSQVVGAP